MTDSCSYFSMWRVFDTLSSRGFAIPTLRSRWSLSMGLLRFSLFEAAKNQSFIKLEPLILSLIEASLRQMRIIIITFTISVFSFYLLVFTFALILLPLQGATNGSLNHLGRCPRLDVFWPFRPPEDSNIAIFYLARSS